VARPHWGNGYAGEAEGRTEIRGHDLRVYGINL
jgi:hypothetical protein